MKIWSSVFGLLKIMALLSVLFTSVALGQAGPASVPESVSVPSDTKKMPERTAKPPSSIKVTFSPNEPGVAFVEVNGERVRIDTAKGTYGPVDHGVNAESSATVKPTPSDTTTTNGENGSPKKDKDDGRFDFQRGYEPFDYRVVNVPTPKHVPKGTWNLAFTHRFTQQIDPIRTSARSLFGLDSFGIASFGISYGITDKLYASAYRSPVCQRGLCKVIEVGVGYNWIAMDKKSPIALTTYASVEGNDNFTEEFTYNLQAMFSGRVGKRVHLFFSPAVHLNSNGQRRFDPRPNDYFPPAAVANTFRLPTHGATFGFGASVLITRNVVALFDVAARTGFKLGRVNPVLDSSFRVIGFTSESHPSMGFGIQRNLGEHSFALTFSNTQTTTTSRYNSSNLVLSPKRMIIGFNLSRRF